MRWLVVTLALLLASASLVSGIYLRDRHPGEYWPTAATQARADARMVLLTTMGWNCRACAVTRLERGRRGIWSAHLRSHAQIRCVQIDLARFSFTPPHPKGIRYVPCS